jgi:hypothetical protein
MITPLTQRQMFQTVNAEAVRTAAEVSGQLQRETATRQALANRMAQDHANVPEIPAGEGLRTEEKQNREQNRGRRGARHGQPDEDEGPEDDGQANPAGPHMDFLA